MSTLSNHFCQSTPAFEQLSWLPVPRSLRGQLQAGVRRRTNARLAD